MSVKPNPFRQRDGGRDEYEPGCYGRSPLFASFKPFKKYELLCKAFAVWRMEEARLACERLGIKTEGR